MSTELPPANGGMNANGDIHDIVSLITSGVIEEIKEDAVSNLRHLSTELDKKQRDMNIAKTTFASAGIIGTGMAIGGAIAAPFTFGTSLGLTAIGIGVGVTSGVGGLATAIADQIVNSNAMKDAEASITRYTKKVNELIDMVNFFYTSTKDEEDMDSEDVIKEELNLIPNEKKKKKVEIFLRGLRTGLDAGSHAFQVGATIGTRVAVAAGRTALGTGLKVVRIGGVVLSVITLPLDFHVLVTNSIKIHRNTPSVVAEQIRDMARTLERHQVLDMDEESDEDVEGEEQDGSEDDATNELTYDYPNV